MKAGDLIIVKRATIGLPKGLAGLIVRQYVRNSDKTVLFEVNFINGRKIRLLPRDLEVINGR